MASIRWFQQPCSMNDWPCGIYISTAEEYIWKPLFQITIADWWTQQVDPQNTNYNFLLMKSIQITSHITIPNDKPLFTKDCALHVQTKRTRNQRRSCPYMLFWYYIILIPVLAYFSILVHHCNLYHHKTCLCAWVVLLMDKVGTHFPWGQLCARDEWFELANSLPGNRTETRSNYGLLWASSSVHFIP